MAAVVLLAAHMLVSDCRAGVAVSEKVLEQAWSRQYESLSAQIRHRGALAGPADPSTVADIQSTILPTDRDALDAMLRRTHALIDRLMREGSADASVYSGQLSRIEQEISGRTAMSKSSVLADNDRKRLFKEVAALNRQALFAGSEIDFDSLIYVERNIWRPFNGDAGGVHMVYQYFGFNARQGGGLYLVKDIRSTPERIDILANSKVENGRFRGRSLAGGAFLSPELSYDGKTILFAWKEPVARNNNRKGSSEESWDPQNCFHIFKVNVDGSGLRQLTDGAHNDFDPCRLPNGRIVFISDRWGGYGRCFDPEARTFLLSSMKDDGTDVVQLSYHETNEWQPSVDNDGKLLYTRWDYVDRDACVAHHVWSCMPDGRDPRSYHGNYPLPFSTWNGNYSGQATKYLRPFAEFGCRAIPGSRKYVATASAHHTEAFGSLVLLDVDIADDGAMSQVTRLTPDVPFPESEDGGWGSATKCLNCVYGTPWPLSEDLFLCHYFPNNVAECNNQSRDRYPDFSTAGIYLIDRSGNQQFICAPLDTTMRAIDPIPVRSRPVPGSLPTQTYQGEREGIADRPKAVISVRDVYVSDLPFPTGVDIKDLRIVQVLPKTTPRTADPIIGYGPQSLARIPLGTVPVESDGSAYFEAPIGKAIYFQALDSSGFAVQSMRSATYVHPGEHLSCLGCHENKWDAPGAVGTPIALKRAASKIQPEVGGVEPVNFHRLVKPVLSEKCAPCHVRMAKGPTDMGYATWKDHAYYLNGANVFTPACGEPTVPYHGGSRTLPGRFGALVSGMRKFLSQSHYGVDLTKEEIRRITLWLDCNSVELGAYTDAEAQRRGELVWPSLGLDIDNPLGVEFRSDRPAASLRILTPDALLKPGADFQFSSEAFDAFGVPTVLKAALTWEVSGGGTINASTGQFAASDAQGGPYTVKASATVDGKELSVSSSFQVRRAIPLPAGVIRSMHFLCGKGSETGSPYLSASTTGVVESTYTDHGGITVQTGDAIPGMEPAPFVWRLLGSSSDGTFVDGHRDHFVAYATITVVSPSDRRMKIGCRHDDDFMAWLNGEPLVTMPYSSSNEQVSDAFTVSKGENTFLFKLEEGSSGNYLAIRLLTEAGGEMDDLGWVADYSAKSDIPTTIVAGSRATVSVPRLLLRSIGHRGGGLHLAVTGARRHTICIYSLSGALIEKFSGVGPKTYSIRTAHMAAGTYIVHARLGSTVIARKAMIR